MPNQINWLTYPSPTTYLTTELNNLAIAGNVVGAAIDNTANGDRWMDIELYLSVQSGTRTAGAHVAVYILSSTDGTNYTFGSASVDPPISAYVGGLQLDAAVSARYVNITQIPLPAGKFKILFRNMTGYALASSGNTVKYAIYNEEIQ